MVSFTGVMLIAGAAVEPAGIATSKPLVNKSAIAAGSVMVCNTPLASV